MSDDRARKPWTLLVYMVAEDKANPLFLDPIAKNEIARIFEFVGAQPSRMHVAIQVDFTRQLGVIRQIAGRSAEHLRESIASDPRVLKQFFDWGLNECPADRYMVLLWGHSSGPAGLFPDGTPGKTTLETSLPLTALGNVFHDAARRIASSGANDKFDIVLFKNCCMSTLETAYELQGSVRYMIASQGRVPAEGYPYERILHSLDARPTRSTAEQILRELAFFYENPQHRGAHEEILYSLVNVEAAWEIARARLDRCASGVCRIGDSGRSALRVPRIDGR
jgi:Clostripain family